MEDTLRLGLGQKYSKSEPEKMEESNSQSQGMPAASGDASLVLGVYSLREKRISDSWP